MGEIELPRAFRLAWSRGASVIAVERDEFDVPWLVRYVIRAQTR